MNTSFSQLIKRKFISAAIATFCFSILFSWLEPDLWGASGKLTIAARLHEAFSTINIYMLYAAPAIYLYGIATSLISEMLVRAVTQRQWLRLSLSAILHCGFGLILLHISMIAAVLYFLADTLIDLKWKQPITMNITVASLLLPISLFLLSVAYLNITG